MSASDTIGDLLVAGCALLGQALCSALDDLEPGQSSHWCDITPGGECEDHAADRETAAAYRALLGWLPAPEPVRQAEAGQ